MSLVGHVVWYGKVGLTPKPQTRPNNTDNFLERQSNRGCSQYQITVHFASVVQGWIVLDS